MCCFAGQDDVKALIKQLAAPSEPARRQEAVLALCRLAGDSKGRREIHSAGGVAPLCSLLQQGEPASLHVRALSTLDKLALDRDCQSALLEAGVVKQLTSFLAPSGGEEARGSAAALLRNLTAYDACGKAICAEPGLLQLTGQLLADGSEAAQLHAAWTLHNLVMQTQRSDALKLALLKAGVIESLIGLLRGASASAAALEARLCAIRATRFLASDAPGCRQGMHDAGVLPVLAAKLAAESSNTPEMQMHAAGTIAKFSRRSSDAILLSGALPHLVRLAGDGAMPLTARQAAETALSRVMSHGGPRAAATVKSAGGQGPSMRCRAVWLMRRSVGTT